MQDTKTGVSTAPVTYQNKVRNFSYTIPAGWRLERGDPTGNAERENIIFMKPGTTCGFNIHWTQMVPSFPRKAAVDASYKQAMEEKGIGKYMAVKRRDQGGKAGSWAGRPSKPRKRVREVFKGFSGNATTATIICIASWPTANPKTLTPTGLNCRELSTPSGSSR